jgi:hypothetical protein
MVTDVMMAKVYGYQGTARQVRKHILVPHGHKLTTDMPFAARHIYSTAEIGE